MQRATAVAAAVWAIGDLVILWFRTRLTGSERESFIVVSSRKPPAIATYVLASVLFIAAMAELVIPDRRGRRGPWSAPLRAVALAWYALLCGSGSGYLYWFEGGPVDVVPAVSVAPVVLGAIAGVLIWPGLPERAGRRRWG